MSGGNPVGREKGRQQLRWHMSPDVEPGSVGQRGRSLARREMLRVRQKTRGKFTLSRMD